MYSQRHGALTMAIAPLAQSAAASAANGEKACNAHVPRRSAHGHRVTQYPARCS
jgi:hypothetical protein